MMFKRSMTLGLVLALGAAVGCSSWNHVEKYAAGGAVLGAGIGAIAGGHGQDLSTAEAAFVGAAGGGLAGALVGDYADRKQGTEEMAAMVADKDKQIAEWQEKERAASRKLASANEDLAAKDRQIETLTKNNAQLTEELANCKGSRTEISMSADVLFNPGSAVLSANGKKALDDAISQIKGQDRMIMVEGHTDTDPIKASNWKSNWELGSARSLTVLHYLIDKGIAPDHLSAATFGQYQPLGNDKSKNRRAVIVLYSGWPSKTN